MRKDSYLKKYTNFTLNLSQKCTLVILLSHKQVKIKINATGSIHQLVKCTRNNGQIVTLDVFTLIKRNVKECGLKSVNFKTNIRNIVYQECHRSFHNQTRIEMLYFGQISVSFT